MSNILNATKKAMAQFNDEEKTLLLADMPEALFEAHKMRHDAEQELTKLRTALIDYAMALEIATTYGLPPHDVSGREAWLSIYEIKSRHQGIVQELAKKEDL